MQIQKKLRFGFLLDKFEETAITILLGTMIAVVFLQIIFRFIIKGSLPWSEELARYLMVWAVFIGASIGAKEGAHIGVEAFISMLPPKLKRFSIFLAGGFSILFCIIVAVLSFIVVNFLMISGQRSPAMEIPIFWAYLAISVGSVLMGIRFIQTTISKLSDRGLNG